MITGLFKKVFGSRNERLLKQYRRAVREINALEPQVASLSDEQLRQKTDEFRDRVAKAVAAAASGGSYTLGDAKLFAQYGNVDNEATDNSYDITGLGTSVKFGAGSLLAQWGRISPDAGAKRTTFSLGYDYFLSKRTDLYAVYMSDKLDGLSSGNSYAVGIRHRF